MKLTISAPKRAELLADVWLAFDDLYSTPYAFEFVKELPLRLGHRDHGRTLFDSSPPLIQVQQGLSDSDLIDTICHELAHVVCGLKEAHSERWDSVYRQIGLAVVARQFERVLNKKAP